MINRRIRKDVVIEQFESTILIRRSQWPLGLWHELSPLARTLGSWVPIPLKA
jgi:hypothetical protein